MSLAEYLAQGKPLLLDGAMGTMLKQPSYLADQAAVRLVHEQYLRAGANCLTVNSFLLNPFFLADHAPHLDMAAENRAAVANAQAAVSAAGKQAFILGNLTTTARLMAPLGSTLPTDIYACYLQQAQVLAASGVDGFLIETMVDLEEMSQALAACLSVSEVPVFCSLTFSGKVGGGCTLAGDKAAECVTRLAQQGAAAVGANCGNFTPQELAQIIAAMRRANADLPLIAQANAGQPHTETGEPIYALQPADFATEMLACRAAGAQLLGGCCGTTPQHIAALAQKLAV